MSQGQVIIRFKGYGQSAGKGGIKKSGRLLTPEEQKEKSRQRLTAYTTKKIISSVKAILNDEIKYEIDKYYSLTDNVQGQRTMNIAIHLTSKAMELGQAFTTGMIVSGNVIGGLVASGLDLIKQGVDIYQGYDKQNIKIRQMEEQLTYTRLRSGYSLTSGDKGENR